VSIGKPRKEVTR